MAERSKRFELVLDYLGRRGTHAATHQEIAEALSLDNETLPMSSMGSFCASGEVAKVVMHEESYYVLAKHEAEAWREVDFPMEEPIKALYQAITGAQLPRTMRITRGVSPLGIGDGVVSSMAGLR